MSAYFDAHCDTALPMYRQGKSLYENNLHLDLKRLSAYRPCGQVFAICVEHGAAMVSETEAVIRNFLREIEKYPETAQLCRSASDISAAVSAGRIAALLSVEGADRLGASAEGLRKFYDLGVRIVHITWNDENFLCGTALGSGAGLTEKGRDFVRAAQEMGVVLDMSHISERGFWDVLEIAEKPVLAGHSNARALCDHPRNLTDEQFAALVQRGGVAGLNFCTDFLGRTRDIDAIIDHAEHWLSLGGEKAVCLGTDFDGIPELPGGIDGAEGMGALYDAMLRRNLREDTVRNIFWNNLNNYFRRVM